ncbi:MAG: tyrosine-type recombinase/integrase, partial [Desulfobacterales bacterium]|nr:tyrosine-type recombinase/integrase [Desulfobacterales bacterium]
DYRTKEGKKKIIPINHHVESVLSGIPRAIQHDFVITFQGEPIRQKDGFKRSLKTACKNAGIPYGRGESDGMTLHDIRRTVKTNMLNAGIDKAIRDTLLGHSLEGMDRHYIVPDERALKKAMARYTEWLDEKLKAAHKKLGQHLVNKL